MTPPTKGADGYYHPRNEQDVRDLIASAREAKKLVRVRGSAHSASAAIYTSCDSTFPCDQHPPPDDGNYNVLLDHMQEVLSWDEDKLQVTVQAGCHLGKDPADPTSTTKNSLFYQMNQKGWAMPDMGGIIRQTVGGFLSTGSAGSSMFHSFSKQLIGLRIIDGTGQTLDLDPSDERFFAAGVSLGLLGIVTQATFQCVPDFNIEGEQSTTTFDDCKVDLFGDGSSGKPTVEEFFRKTEHTRFMWWPQKGAERIQIWQAHTLKPEEGFVPKPYKEFPKIFGSLEPAELVTGGILRALAYWNTKGFLGTVTRWVLTHIYPWVIRTFEPVDGAKGPLTFQDYWWRGLPMDNTASDTLMPTRFTELWIPLHEAQEVMREMRRIYVENGVWASGSYSTEIYPTPANDYWMSPAYKQDVLKVDVFWFEKNKGDPIESFYPQFWNGLKRFNFRPHWGKYLPFTASNPTEWLDYVRPKYPMWDAFMSLRATMDPDQIFVSDYWRTQLGIEQP